MLKLQFAFVCTLLSIILTACVSNVDESLPYNKLPEITLAAPLRLVASPQHATSYLSQSPIAEGTKVQLLGSDPNVAWLLVRHESILGWMPTIFSRTNIATLPIAITLDTIPSDCVYLGSTFSLDETWLSPIAGTVIVVGSLYRPEISSEFSDASLQLTIDGSGQVIEGDYIHTVLTNESAVILFGYSATKVTKGSTLGFSLTNASKEPLNFVASVFSGECREERLTDLLPVGLSKTITVPVLAQLPDEPNESASNSIIVTNGSLRPTPPPSDNQSGGLKDEVRPLGTLWEADGVAMNLIRLEIRAENGEDAAARAWFKLFNNTGYRLLVEIDWNNIYCEDSYGTKYVDWNGGGTTSVWIEVDQSFSFDRFYTVEPRTRSRIPPSAEYVQCKITEFSRIKNAWWQFNINPTLMPIALKEFAEVKELDEAWETNGLRFSVTNADIRAASNGEDAAVHLWFLLENSTNDTVLVELNLGQIYVTDSFGRRFNDWNGGESWSFSLGPGESRSFDRYYSEMAGMRSRITRGSEFVVIQAFDIGRISRAAWYIPIIR